MAPSPAADGERLEAKFDALSTQVEELTKAVNTVLKLQEAQVKGEAQRSQGEKRAFAAPQVGEGRYREAIGSHDAVARESR